MLSFTDILYRIILAILFGGIIGIERGKKGHAAGFRTYILVTMGSCLGVLVAEYIFIIYKDSLLADADVFRIPASVISGVGFLATGTIIKNKYNRVKGLTTASGLWACASVGVVCGIGFYKLVAISFIFIIIIIRFLTVVENRIMCYSKYFGALIRINDKNVISDITENLKNMGAKIREVEIFPDYITIDVEFDKKIDHNQVIAKLSSIDGVLKTEEVKG